MPDENGEARRMKKVQASAFFSGWSRLKERINSHEFCKIIDINLKCNKCTQYTCYRIIFIYFFSSSRGKYCHFLICWANRVFSICDSLILDCLNKKYK